MHRTHTEYSIRVSDSSARDMGGELSEQCYIVIYGVFFDFDKATLKVAIQGHTDGIGTDAYNLTLSDARAHSVATWLPRHGIAADRLTAKGYGKAMPIALNDNNEGRAKNRRVEVARPDCRGRSAISRSAP